MLDSLGIGEMPDAPAFGDAGSNTIRSISSSDQFSIPNLLKAGFGNIEGLSFLPKEENPIAAYGRMGEKSQGKDTTVGHWELAGVISPRALPTYPEGFPEEVIQKFQEETGRGVLCNRPYSGTQVIADFGEEHCKTGDLIVYTSADSVFQIAAHEEKVPLEELYRDCKIARKILQGEHSVGRVIARPFVTGEEGFVRTSNRHDFSLEPPEETMLDRIKKAGLDVISVGKIADIFAHRGITEEVMTKSNQDGMTKLLDLIQKDFSGLCFANLVEFDSHYGHRNDVSGYARALSEFDEFLPQFLAKTRPGDLVVVTADHGCDPGTPSTDHSREYVPVLFFGDQVRPGSLGTVLGFSYLTATCEAYLGLPKHLTEEGFSIFR